MTVQDQRNLGKFAERGDASGVEACLRAGADAGHVNENGVSLLLRALVGTYNPEVLRLLLAAGADPNRATRQGETALMMAVGMGRGLEAVNMLLDAGADVRAIGPFGQTVLHFAVASVSAEDGPEPVESVRVLLKRGAPMDVRASAGKGSALMQACLRGCKEICGELLNAGAPIEESLREDGLWECVAESVIPRAARNAKAIHRLVESHVLMRSINGAMDAPEDDRATTSEPKSGSGMTL